MRSEFVGNSERLNSETIQSFEDNLGLKGLGH